MNSKVDLIVTRHPTLVRLLIERGLATADTPVVEHATAKDVRGKHVAGILPHHLSSDAASVTEIPMRLTLADREAAQAGDLPLERIRQVAGDTTTYTVQAVIDPRSPSLAVAAAARYCEGFHGVVDGPITYAGIGPKTWRDLDVMYFGSMCGQFSAAVVLSRGIWMQRQGERRWLDGLGRPVDINEVAGNADWKWRIIAKHGLDLHEPVGPGAHSGTRTRPARFGTKVQAWDFIESLATSKQVGPWDGVKRRRVDLAVAPECDPAWAAHNG